jgi:hypothetical protein
MFLHRPIFRLWPTIAAILFSYLIAGAIYGLVTSAQTVSTSNPSFLGRISLALLFAFLGAGRTIISAGMPVLNVQTPINAYPVIVPVMLVLLALTSGIVRIGSNSRKYLLWALAIGLLFMAAGCVSGIYFFRNCGPYMCD